MITRSGREEAATPSGCCALAAYLALQKGEKGSRHAYAIMQGLEMVRPSQFCVEVRLNDQGTKVTRIILSGRGVFVSEGKLL
jgi:predicted PhzF superfamily epimerase YddE/YHI9